MHCRLRRAAAAARDRLREWLPVCEYGTCAGVSVPERASPRRVGDRLTGRDTPEHLPFEGGLASVHREHTRADDRVVVVGGGFGVTAVAAREAGAAVTVYEASPDRLATLRRTLRLNGLDRRELTLRWAAVAGLTDAEAAAKALPDPPTVAPADLPACNVLELDCEGAELAVLRGLADPAAPRPRLLAVELHPIKLNGRTDAAREALADLGYDPRTYLTHDGRPVDRATFEALLAGTVPDTPPAHQAYPPVLVAERV